MPDHLRKNGYIIRPYRRGDRQAVRDICAATCWMGEYRPELIGDDWLWAEYWTRYFTDVEPRHTWIVQRTIDGEVLGYLTGTVDERRFFRYAWRIMPGIVAHVTRRRLVRNPVARRAILSMLRAMMLDKSCPEAILREFPATWHFDLLPEGRRMRAGFELVRTFLNRMKALGIAGVHGEPLSLNRGVGVFLRRLGFHLAHSRATRAFAHVEQQPVAIETWVKKL